MKTGFLITTLTLLVLVHSLRPPGISLDFMLLITFYQSPAPARRPSPTNREHRHRRFLMVGSPPPIICRRAADATSVFNCVIAFFMLCMISPLIVDLVQNRSRHLSQSIRANVKVIEFDCKNPSFQFLYTYKVREVTIQEFAVFYFQGQEFQKFMGKFICDVHPSTVAFFAHWTRRSQVQ